MIHTSPPSLRLITWNINSLRLRLPLLQQLVAQTKPDVLCLQETKVPDSLFPTKELRALGFEHQLYRGMKGYNGVAILSRYPLTPLLDTVPPCPPCCAPEECRHLAATLTSPWRTTFELHTFYVPAGGDVPDPHVNPKFAHKLTFVEEVTHWFQHRATRHPLTRLILTGDFNIAPLEHDVWSHKQLLNVVSHTPPETERLTAWLHTGFVDAMRHFVPPSEKLYTWWSYRNKDWKKSNRGRRLDHIWVTPDLVKNLSSLDVLAPVRDWSPPSDHVPVVLDFSS